MRFSTLFDMRNEAKIVHNTIFGEGLAIELSPALLLAGRAESAIWGGVEKRITVCYHQLEAGVWRISDTNA